VSACIAWCSLVEIAWMRLSICWLNEHTTTRHQQCRVRIRRRQVIEQPRERRVDGHSQDGFIDRFLGRDCPVCFRHAILSLKTIRYWDTPDASTVYPGNTRCCWEAPACQPAAVRRVLLSGRRNDSGLDIRPYRPDRMKQMTRMDPLVYWRRVRMR
jgi:hypothetical protein